MAEIVGYLDKTLRSDAILTNGAGNYSGFLHRFYKYAHATQPRHTRNIVKSLVCLRSLESRVLSRSWSRSRSRSRSQRP